MAKGTRLEEIDHQLCERIPANMESIECRDGTIKIYVDRMAGYSLITLNESGKSTIERFVPETYKRVDWDTHTFEDDEAMLKYVCGN